MRYAQRMDQVRSSFIRDNLKVIQIPGMISFAGGMPAAELFPVEAYREACNCVLSEHGRQALQYDTTDGYRPLRQIIASDLMRQAGVTGMSEDNIVITTGSQQGIDCAGKLFLDPTDVVLCEKPSFIGAINAFRVYQPQIVQVEMDDKGLRIDALEEALKTYPRAKFIYTIPDFQNPSGLSLDLERRKQLVGLAEQYDVPIIEDSPYHRLRYTGPDLPAVKSFDTRGLVIYLGTFSKIFSPGIRLAWMCASEEVISKVILLKQSADLHTSSIAQRELVKLMEIYSFEEHVQCIKQVYSARKDLMLDRIAAEFPDCARVSPVDGGLFLWVTLPAHVDTMDLYFQAIDEKVTFVPGSPFFVDDSEKNHMRLNFSSMQEEKIVEGMKRLGKLVRSVC